MKHTLTVCLLTAMLIQLCLGSCQPKALELSDLSQTEVDSLNAISDTLTPGAGLRAKGTAEKAWNRFFRDCVRSYNMQSAVFAGYSNNISVGDIRTGDGLASYSLRKLISPQEYESWISKGNQSAGCSLDKDIDRKFGIDIGASFLAASDLDLQIAATLLDSTKMTIGNYLIEEINNVDGLQKFIDSDPRLKDFKEQIKRKKRDIIVQAVKVSNAEFNLTLKRDFETKLSGKLDSTITDNLNVQGGKLRVTYSKINERTIKCKVENDFYIFMRLKKDI